MMENDCLRLLGAPILVEDPSPVLRGDEGHVKVIPDQVAGQQDRRRCLVIGWRARTGQMSVELTPDSVAGQELLASCLCLVTEEPTRRRSRSSARSAEHTSELQSLMRLSYAVFSLQKKNPVTTVNILVHHLYHNTRT